MAGGTLRGLLAGLAPEPSRVDQRSLRRLYAVAARLHHPDVGGTTRGMVLVAEAYRARDVRRLRDLITAGRRIQARRAAEAALRSSSR